MTYFYPATRAHHAYTMALDFGMKFAKRDGFWTPEGLLTVTGAGGYRIEIAEESLGLLVPRVGDLAIGSSGGAPHIITLVDDGKHCEEFFGGRQSCWSGMHRFENPVIIQRDGRLFHWPEQAKAEGV